MSAELALDAASFLGLIPSIVVTVPLALAGNGRRPLALLILIMVALSLWQGFENLDSDQTLAQHVRAIAAVAALFVCPLWAALDGRKRIGRPGS